MNQELHDKAWNLLKEKGLKLREKIVQRLKDNRNLAANAAISCAEKKDWYNYEHYVKRSLHYENVVLKIEMQYKML